MSLEPLNGLIQALENQDSWQLQRQFRLVVQHWPSVVGFAVARQTRPIGIRRTTLYVATSTAAWAQTLTYERLNILRKLNRYQHQTIRNIRFSTAQWSQTQPVTTDHGSLDQHPSYVGNHTDLQPAEQQVEQHLKKTEEIKTPQVAFERWASKIQNQQRHQASCDRCHCCCPQGELERWGVCALCAAKQWQL